MSDQGYQGFQNPQSGANEFNAMNFLVRQILSTMHTATLVKVTAVTNSGTVSTVGTVDVQPLINQLDGFQKSVPHGKLYKLPYSRAQGGANAVILDPQVGDIGVAVFAERDISNIKSTKAQGNPASARKFDMADGVYVATLWAQAPTNYIQFNSSGITVHSPNTVTISAPAVKIQNAGSSLQTLLNSTLLTWLNSHVHGNGNNGANTTGPTTTPASTVSTSITKAE